jgi:hypothetical protein
MQKPKASEREEIDRIKSAYLQTSKEIRELAHHEAQQKIKSQQDIALAADRRALDFARFGIILIAAEAALCIALFPIDHPQAFGSIFVSAVLARIGSIIAIYSAKPGQIWRTPGSSPIWYEKDIINEKNYDEVLSSALAWANWYIDQNEAILKRNSDLSRKASWIIVFSPIIGLIIFAIFRP